MAFDALMCEMVDDGTLNTKEEPFVKAFFSWAWENKGMVRGIMDEFMKVPERFLTS